MSRMSLAARLRTQWKLHPAETAFAVLGLVFGLLFVWLTPPGQVADEKTHFYRAYQLSEGHILSQALTGGGYGDYLPRQVLDVSEQLYGNIPGNHAKKFPYRKLPGLLKQRINGHDTVPVHLEGAAVYSPVGYLPQVVAIWVVKLVWPSVVLMYYVGRMFNLAVWLACMYAALRLWPGNKWPLFALGLIPMAVSEAGSLSQDAAIYGLAFLTVAAAIRLAVRQKPVRTGSLLLLGAGVVALALCKPVFVVFGLVVFLLGPHCFAGRRQYWLAGGGMVLAAVVAGGGWNLLVQPYTVGIQHRYYAGADLSVHRQLVSLLRHPLHLLRVLANTYLSSFGDTVVRSYIGRLGWWDVDLPLWQLATFYVLLVLAIINRGRREISFTLRQRWAALALFGLGALATTLALYLTVTPVAAPTVGGLQGRYLIPFTPLLAIAFGGLLVVERWERIAPRLFPIAYAIMLSASLVTMVVRFV